LSDYVVAKRYAKALYASAEEAGVVEKISGELQLAAQIYKEEEQFRAILSHPGVENDAKFDLFKQSFGEALSELVYNMVKLLIERGRLALLPSICQAYLEIADERSGRAQAKVYSVYPLTDEDKRAVEAHFSKITGKQISVDNIIDRSLIGGIRVRIGDRLYDGSVAGKLQQLQNQLKQNA